MSEVVEPTTPEAFESLEKLNKDLKTAARTLGKREIRYLVDSYYTAQKYRIAADAQVRASADAGEPNRLLVWNAEQFRRFESNYQKAMDVWTNEYTVGKWLKSICGIGPVISAGLLVHLDIRQAKTKAHFWSYAGMNDKCIWPNKESAIKGIKEAIEQFELQEYNANSVVTDYYLYSKNTLTPSEVDITAANVLLTNHSSALVRSVIPTMARMHRVQKKSMAFWTAAKEFDHGVNFFRQLLQEKEITDLVEESTPIPFPVVRIIAEKFGRHPINLLQKARKGNGELTIASLTTALLKRPWNVELKTLIIFKLGECFVKVQANKNDFYGHLFRMKRDEQEQMNVEGKHSEFAKITLSKKKFGDDTKAKEAYTQGKLPPAHLHARARRWVTKIFVSHLFEIMWRDFYETEPPTLYEFEYLPGNHRHKIEVFNFSVFLNNKGKSIKDMKE